MSMTNSIYDVELYPLFLFSYEEYLSVNSRTELPLKCSHCGETFYRQKKQLTSDIKKGKLNFYCCKKCSDNARIKPNEERTYTCKLCGKVFTELPSKYASGEFCSKDCARKYSSQFASTEEIRKKKSDDMCDKLGIPHKEALLPKRSERKKRNICYKPRPKVSVEEHIKKSQEENEIFYNQIMELYEDYNFTDIQKKLNISHNKFKSIKELYSIKENTKFISHKQLGVIKFCKHILHKETSITIDDYNKVKNILLKHLYEDNMSPLDIKNLYQFEYSDFGMLLKGSFDIKLRSLKDASKNYHTNIGTYDNKTEKEIYYLNCAFRFGLDDFKRVEGFDLIQKYGMYSVPDNLNGMARDHMISIYYGWTHNIPPEVIRHPANCRIINQRENSSKGEKCSISIEELYERIKNW